MKHLYKNKAKFLEYLGFDPFLLILIGNFGGQASKAARSAASMISSFDSFLFPFFIEVSGSEMVIDTSVSDEWTASVAESVRAVSVEV